MVRWAEFSAHWCKTHRSSSLELPAHHFYSCFVASPHPASLAPLYNWGTLRASSQGGMLWPSEFQSTIYQPASEYALHVAHNAFYQLALFLFLTSLSSFLFLTSFPTITTSVLFHPIYANIHTCLWCFHISWGVPFFFLIWKLPYLFFRLLIQLLLPYEDFNPLIIMVAHIATWWLMYLCPRPPL